MPRPVHFEIHAEDTSRAKTFYETVFDWKITKWEGPIDYWMVITGDKNTPGINGGMIKRPHPLSGNDGIIAYVCTMEIENIDAFMKKITDHGGTLALPKQAIPGVGWISYMKDTEGNVFGLMQNDTNAK